MKVVEFLASFILDGSTNFSLFEENNFGWYLAALCIYTLVTFIVRDINPVFVLIIATIIGCMAGYDSMVMRGQFYGRVIVFYPFYFLGVMLDMKKIVSYVKKHRKFKFVLGMAILAIWGGYCIACRTQIMKLWGFVIPRTLYAELPFSCNGFTRLIYYAAVCILGTGFLFVIPTFHIKGISKFGTRTLAVYIYHILVRNVLYKFGVTDYLCGSKQGIVVYIFLNLFVTVVFSTKFFSIPTEWMRKMCCENDKIIKYGK